MLKIFSSVSTSGLGKVAVQRPAHTRADSITERTGLTLCSLDERSVTNLPSGSVFLLSVRHSPIAECDTLSGTHTHTLWRRVHRFVSERAQQALLLSYTTGVTSPQRSSLVRGGP